MNFTHAPRWLLRLIKRPPQIVYALGLGLLIGRLVLLLTTIGRKSGKPRVTPLQYEELNGAYYIGSARGAQADWCQNINANPRVQVRVKNRRFKGHAEISTDPGRIADYLEFRLQRRPRMFKVMLRAEGLRADFSREQLERIAHHLALVIIHPDDKQ